jgi:hypothetical protein
MGEAAGVLDRDGGLPERCQLLVAGAANGSAESCFPGKATIHPLIAFTGRLLGRFLK